MHNVVFLFLIWCCRITGGVDVNLLSSQENYFSNENVNFEIRLTNNSNNKITYAPNTSNSTSHHGYWRVKIINLNSGNQVISNNDVLVRRLSSLKKDYQILQPNDTSTINFSIDFNKLVIVQKKPVDSTSRIDDLFISEPDNIKYGKYSIKIEYVDIFKKHKHAIDRFQTNEIVVNYLKK